MNLELEYQRILALALSDGVERDDRTGVGSRSLFSQNLQWHANENNFPFMTGKKLYWKNVVAEFQWFIHGETNTDRFQKENVHIWDHWADSRGNLGPVYGYQMRSFNSEGCDQLMDIVNSIIYEPDSRRHIITLWNPLQTDKMSLPACYHNFQFFVDKERETLSMHVLQRSADLFIGIPYDIALFTLFNIYIAQLTNYRPGKVSLTMVDAHVYNNQHDQINEYLSRDIHRFPRIEFNEIDDIQLIDYKSNSFIKTDLAI